MRKQTVWLLIVLVGVFATFLVVMSGRTSPFQKLLAQVGITVGVAPNPYNTLDAQLSQQEDQLNQEASDLAAREAAFASSTATTSAAASPAVWYLALVVALIALLVLLNFYLDWRRARREELLLKNAGSPTEKKEPAATTTPSEAEKPKE